MGKVDRKDLAFGGRLKWLREGRRIKQAVAAKEIDISYSSLQKYESGAVPTLKMLNKIINYYQCSKSWLMDGIGEPFPGREGHHNEPLGGEREANKYRESANDAAQRPSIRVSDALIMASRVLESGTTYADALYTNIVHFDRAVQAEKGMPRPTESREMAPLLSRIESSVAEMKKEWQEAVIRIGDIVRIIGRNIDLDGLLDVFLEKAMKATGATIGSIVIRDPKTGEFRIAASRGTLEEGPKKDSYIDIQKSMIKTVIENKKTLLVQNIETDPRTLKKSDPKYGPPSFLSMPVMTEGETVAGAVNLAKKNTGRLFDRDDEEAMNRIIPEVSAALKKSEIPNGHHSK